MPTKNAISTARIIGTSRSHTTCSAIDDMIVRGKTRLPHEGVHVSFT